MLIINLIGGLGNQMFQYAFGKGLSMQRHIEVKFSTEELLDCTPKENFTYRDYELGNFRTNVVLASTEEMRLFKYQPANLSERIFYKLKRHIMKPKVFNETANFRYDAGVYQTAANMYYDGYWQNEKYFSRFESKIRHDFTFQHAPTGLNAELVRHIQASRAVAIHVRRGDYVTNSQTNQIHGTCSPDYYREAVSLLAQRIPNPTLFVFSDEPEWVKQHLSFGSFPTVYISHNKGSDSYQDLRLMSLCQHNIIANSSFSWWGAWLNANPDKLVVAPRQWYQGVILGPNELLPASWLRL